MSIVIFPRTVKSFVKRHRPLTPKQEKIMAQSWAAFGVDVPTDGLLDFSAIFKRFAPLVCEIGFGHGDTLLPMSLDNPGCDYVGIEVHAPGVAAVLQQVMASQITNVRVIQHDAVDVLQKHISDHTFSRIHIYFPDPWPKKKHHKRRIIEPEFVALLLQKLSPGGVIHCATDWQPYAEHMMTVLSSTAGLINCVGENQYADNTVTPLRAHTKFERRGVKLGHGVWDLLFKRVT